MSRVSSAPFRTCHPSYSNWLSNRLYECYSSNDIEGIMHTNNQSYCLNSRAFYNAPANTTRSVKPRPKLGAIIGKQMHIFNLTQVKTRALNTIKIVHLRRTSL